MDKIVIAQKIDSVLRCLNRIQQRLPETEADFIKDYDAQDVVVLNLTRAIQMNVDIATHILANTNQAVPATMAEAFTSLEHLNIISPDIADKMRRSIGYRNVAVHNYDDIDLAITYEIASHHLEDFKDYIKQIMLRNEHEII
ncbi:type VII toxin-antitoxin system HepT family RNase toxin [Methyloprofundus sp.]|uniref:type VII toxin-antitoxin system HepT family RNase toxin n=1 Tax=Methyloprofundus sp. TaxID=2020875 RepID=UPI003D10C1D2